MSRVVQGVRRWIGARQSTHEKKARGKSISKPEIKKPPQDKALNPRSTKAVALALLDPQVSEGEEAEYAGWVPFTSEVLTTFLNIVVRYIEQCQELLDAPVTSLEKRNLEVYEQAIQIGKGGGITDDWTTGFEIAKDYISYVERSTTDYLDGAWKEAFPVTYNYERWLTNVA